MARGPEKPAYALNIRKYDDRIDRAGVSDCFVELQDEERLIDERMPCGRDIVADYIPTMLDRCVTAEGRVFVAEIDGNVVGFTTVLTRVSSDDIDSGDLEYGLVSDLVVSKKYRSKGFGRRLLAAAENYAREKHVQSLRVGVLSANVVAGNLYATAGFSDLYVELEKDLSGQS